VKATGKQFTIATVINVVLGLIALAAVWAYTR